MIDIIKAIIFGIVEGITEWLPVSSTGHMILLNEILPLNMSQEFYDMFLVVIQLGAILAVVEQISANAALKTHHAWAIGLHGRGDRI